jgi:hypothetical protein
MKESDREKLLRKREKQKAKDDSKLEKQRRLKEEKLRKVADKEKERDKKKQQKIKQKAVSLTTAPSKLSDFIQVSVGWSFEPDRVLQKNKINVYCRMKIITYQFSWKNVSNLSRVRG